MNSAIIASTDKGLSLALRLQTHLPSSLVVTTRPCAGTQATGISSIREFLQARFSEFGEIIFIGALGICVRSLAPFIEDKQRDPAVLNIDEEGRFVQAVLSGHKGGANSRAQSLARHLGAQPVITTASDVQGLWALDTLGDDHGWTAHASPGFTKVISNFVNRKPTLLLLEVSDKGTESLERTAPPHVRIVRSLNEVFLGAYALLIAVTYRQIEVPIPCVHYWPKVLSLGVGCTRNAPVGLLTESVFRMLDHAGYARAAVRNVASARIKADEEALLALARDLGVPMETHANEVLLAQEATTPSEVVLEKVGVPSVSEAAALASSQGGSLLMPKRRAALSDGQHHTLAVALHGSVCRRAHISIVGAGPGDPELISLKGRRLLETADFILYAGSLVPEALTHCAKPGATVRSSADLDLGQQLSAIAQHYERGHAIVRLHTGDPCLYGAIQEQMEEYDKRGWSYSIVPGISAFQAAAARLQTEFTVPELVQTIILTRGEGATPMPARERLADLASHRATLCVYLSIALADRVQAQLLEHYPPETPLAILHRISWPEEKVFTGRLDELAAIVAREQLTRTTLIVVSPALGARGAHSLLYAADKAHGFRPRRKEGS